MTDTKWYRISDADKARIMHHVESITLSTECGLRGDGINGSITSHTVEPLTKLNDEPDGLEDTVRYHNQVVPDLLDEVLGCMGESMCASKMLDRTYDPMVYLIGKHSHMTDTVQKVTAFKAVLAACMVLMEVHDQFEGTTADFNDPSIYA